MASRETRRYKQRGMSISFGDIMLPLVGIVAIGLLVVGGKLFFLNGIRPERSPVPLARERSRVEPESIRREDTSSGLVAGLLPEGAGAGSGSSSASAVSSDAVVPEGKLPTPRRASLAMDVLAIPYGVASESSAPSKEVSGNKKEAPEKRAVSDKKEGSGKPNEAPRPRVKRVEIVAVPAKKPAAPPAQAPRNSKASPAPQTARKPASAPAPAKPRAPETVPPKSAPQTKNALWRVQVGAFSTKDSAAEVSRKLSQSGYKASIVSGSRFHRVLVQGGATRQDAAAVVSRLGKEGFSGAFAIPPSSP